MQEIEHNFSLDISFTEHVPELLIAYKELDLLYEKAFLDRETKGENEYNQNTTTWD